MAKNHYLAQQAAIRQGYFEVGLRCGRQQILDMVSRVLRDPEIMGKDTFGGKRLMKVVKGVGEYIDKYNLAWQRHDDTDYWRAKLDEALEEAYGETLHDSFLERYECAPEFNYNTGRWSK